MGEYEKPDQALSRARAMWGSRRVYIAEIAPLDVGEGLPNIASLVGEVRETLVEKYGSGADSVFDSRKVMVTLEGWWQSMIERDFAEVIAIFSEEEDFMVAHKVKSYTALQTVKLGDFK